MADTLVPSSSTWTTSDMLPVTGETAPATWGQGAVNNGGYNYMAVHMISKQTDNLIEVRATPRSDTHKAWMRAGIWTIQAALGVAITGAWGTSYVSVDGTQIILKTGSTFAGVYTGSATVDVGTADAWVDVVYYAVGTDASNEASTYDGALYCVRSGA